MGEEAFDEINIECPGGYVLYLTGGYSRDEVYLGIGKLTAEERAKGDPGMPLLCAQLDRKQRTQLRKALRELMGGRL